MSNHIFRYDKYHKKEGGVNPPSFLWFSENEKEPMRFNHYNIYLIFILMINAELGLI